MHASLGQGDFIGKGRMGSRQIVTQKKIGKSINLIQNHLAQNHLPKFFSLIKSFNQILFHYKII